MENFIKKLREEKGIKQKTLAELTGIPVRTLSRIESTNRISYVNAKKIADKFNLSITDFDPIIDPAGDEKHIIDISSMTKWHDRIDRDLIPVRLLPREATACCGPGNNLREVIMDTDQEILASRDMLGSTFDDAKPIFAMHTEGDSMVFAGIPEHSIIIVNQAEEVHTGAVALVRVGDTVMVKRVVWRRDGGVDLLSDGETSSKISFDKEDIDSEWVVFCGKVTGVQMKVR